VTNENLHNLLAAEANELAFVDGEYIDDGEFRLERFVFDEEYNIIDKLNQTAPMYPYCRLEEHPTQDQRTLREVVLWRRLDDLVSGLILNLEPERTKVHGDEHNHRQDAQKLGYVLYELVCASALNTLDPSIAIQARFDGNLSGQKRYLQEVTSLWLFRDDVERILRDLYGDIESDGMDRALGAIFAVVREFTYHVRRDVFCEHQNAQSWDYIFGAGLPDGYGISGSDHSRAHAGLRNLIAHVREVRKNPPTFSKYTVEFATRRVQEFVNVDKVLAELDAAS
jgi:hypothetical protein